MGSPFFGHARRSRICRNARLSARGATLVELVVMISVVGIAAAVIAGAIGNFTKGNEDPVIRVQSIAIAESMLAEVLQQGTPDNDPDGGVENLGPEPGESRGSATYPFDSVNDYNGYTSNGIVSLNGTAISGLSAYSVSVAVSNTAIGATPATDGWWVDVTVTGPDGKKVVLSGWRARLSG